MGIFCIFLFVLLRGQELWYNADRESMEPSFGNFGYSWNWKEIKWRHISCFNVSKYPPSIAHICMASSMFFCLLVLIESMINWENWQDAMWKRVFIVIGRVTLFYWIIHWIVTYLIGGVILFIAIDILMN